MRLDSGRMISDFDPHFKIFDELMPFKVREILLVSSPYDAFIMEEDGSLASRIVHEYQGLNLSGAPRLTLVSSGREALEALRRRSFDLVITMPNVGGMDAFSLGAAIKNINSSQQVVLIAHSLQGIYPLPASVDCQFIDNIFLWCCEADLLLAVIKNFEDHVNVDADTARAMVRVIILVEDSPVYRSYFLPLIYHEVVRQTQGVLGESLNERHRLLRMRARPKILSAINYEEAMTLYQAYKPYVFGIISDVRYPRQGKMDAEAGLRFLKLIREDVPDLPLLMLSSEPENRKWAESIPAVFLDKNTPHVKEEIHSFFFNYLGFGDFVFRLPDGTAIGRASNLSEFEAQLRTIPDESLRYHAQRNHFSNWVMARAEVALATRLHRDHIGGIKRCADMREDIVFKVHSLRKLRQQGVVVRFSRDHYDPAIMDFVKIGDGSMGGKARGLAFMWMQLQQARGSHRTLAENNVSLPKTCVLTADGFDDFIRTNNFVFQEEADEAIGNRFLAGELPDWLKADLRAFLSRVTFPLSVRSSSLLEDAQFKPYAGLYSTYFLTNNHPDLSVRCQNLERAIKLVYASTWFEGPRSFSRLAEKGGDDSMAVIIQQVVGQEFGGYWYPHISGVAQSHNFYPVMKMKAEDGICHIAMGVGKTVVEGEKSLRFSPAHPEHLVQFSTVDDILENCQRQFYALDMGRSEYLDREGSNLVRRGVQDAEQEGPVQLLASTYIAEENRIRDSVFPGLKVLTFAKILKHQLYPLPEILRELLDLGQRGMGCEVEIEFAVRLDEKIHRSEFFFLQMRPMVTGGEHADVAVCAVDIDAAFCFSTACLGHGRFEDMADIVVVRPDTFNPAQTRKIGEEISVLNSRLLAEERRYLLIGPGRWGSADPWLGVPVQWRDISGVGAIVELQNATLHADPSQGSHFFQNITSLGIPYLTVKEQVDGSSEKCSSKGRSDCLNWQWLLAQERKEDGPFVRHIRLPSPFVMKCNGKEEIAVLHVKDRGARPGERCPMSNDSLLKQ
ncbi:MAG: phosphoenolpyruvate synthase/pyruvate phosphate dikinase [Proteobacteria bacterium]|nr:phosphoenolpyruvate synthase/pyruvate phosphate dikinase [Pseudomonadota bacterium]MBU1057760.1 phosphoenolpyruvate synthase/pyruvate phosphate dikinase [Pseudomonadota bacterium]